MAAAATKQGPRKGADNARRAGPAAPAADTPWRMEDAAASWPGSEAAPLPPGGPALGAWDPAEPLGLVLTEGEEEAQGEGGVPWGGALEAVEEEAGAGAPVEELDSSVVGLPPSPPLLLFPLPASLSHSQ